MLPDTFDLDTFLAAPALDGNGSLRLDSEGAMGAENGFNLLSNSGIVPWIEPDYTGKIDYRIRQLSYSALGTLHSCPRKFQLNRLRTTHGTVETEEQTVTFSFGHCIGEAIQLALQGKTLEQIVMAMLLMWKPPLFAEDAKRGKSFWEAVTALKKFLALREQGFLQDYELVYYDGVPACELSFAIVFPDGFRLRGFVDAVLRHKVSGKILVLELKTTSARSINPAMYKNSAQAVGYSVVLDHLFPELSSYEVLYLVYQTGARTYEPIPFVKTYLQRALWIRELLLDIEFVKMCEDAEVYPMRGESCFAFMRECEYFQVCTLSTEYLTKPCTELEQDTTKYQVEITLADLLDTQIRKLGELGNDTSTEDSTEGTAS